MRVFLRLSLGLARLPRKGASDLLPEGYRLHSWHSESWVQGEMVGEENAKISIFSMGIFIEFPHFYYGTSACSSA